MKGKCKNKDVIVMRFGCIDAVCYLNFGYNTRFDFYTKDNKCYLSRKNIDLEFSKEEFEKNFIVVESEDK